jgi:hypothetical protein
MNWHEKFGTPETTPDQLRAVAKGYGVDPSIVEPLISEKTTQLEEGPVTPEYPLPTKVEMSVTPGGAWQVAQQKNAETRKHDAEVAQAKLDQNNIANSLRQQGLAIQGGFLGLAKEKNARAINPDVEYSKKYSEYLKLYKVHPPMNPDYTVGDPVAAAKKDATDVIKQAYPDWAGPKANPFKPEIEKIDKDHKVNLKGGPQVGHRASGIPDGDTVLGGVKVHVLNQMIDKVY